MPDLPVFPSSFLWGVATSSYQVEGAVDEGGRGRSVWDTFAHTPGRIHDGSTGDVACDQFHRYPEDIALMSGLGLNAYRFSIAWPRIQPDGTGPANAEGLAYYDRLVDALLSAGLTPVPTLYHWDLPQPLEDGGGWLSRDTAQRFADFAGLVAARLADRVPHWITLNEPFIHLASGYALGVEAPGRTLLLDALPAGHHLMLGHGMATAALRAAGAGEVMVTHNYTPVTPASDSPDDLAAAHAYDLLHNWMLTDPVLLGRYPDLSALGLPGDAAPPWVADGDLATIAAPLDGLGVNYYNPSRIAAAGTDVPNPFAPLPFVPMPIDGVPHTGFGWPVVPSGLRDLLLQLGDRYGDALPPVYVTENGCSYPDAPDGSGAVHDPDRIAYLDGHLRALHEAMAAGVDVRGYFVWSILDNFEWSQGYSQRFGLVHVDFGTQRRTPKDSYAWLRDQLARQREATSVGSPA
ncbi:MAG TPA: GH1 family beta-glucosidase [Kineosporiaceae bacterium]|nr:GH1 family beta-glucosidase [Kineosporiaceae bacterium]